MKKKYFIVKNYEPYGIVDDIIYTFLVIADSEKEAEEKFRKVKKVTGELQISECTPTNGIIFLGRN